MLGALWLLLTVWSSGRGERRARRMAWFGWGAVTVGALAELALQGPDVAGTGPSRAFDASLLDATLHTGYGQLHSARLVLLGILAVVMAAALRPVRRRRWHLATFPLLVAVAVTFTLSGHPATTNPAWLSEAADVLHLCSMALWVGGLVLVVSALLPRRDPDELRTMLPAFSRVAFVSVVTIAVTGSYAAWRGIGVVRAIFTTEYGLLVLAKIALFLGLIALGDVSRRVIQRRIHRLPVAHAMTDTALEERPPVAPAEVLVERMRRSVLVEIALAALVLAATAVLVDQPRGREALAAQDREPVSATAQLGAGRTVTVTVAPGQHGVVTAEVALSPGPQPAQVTATASQPSRQLGPIPLKLSPDGKNLYTASGIDLPVPGRWVITLVVTRSQFDAVTTDVAVDLH